MTQVVIVDLGTGNLRSVSKAAARAGAASVSVSAAPSVIAAAGHLILPGQGAIGAWFKQLAADSELRAAVLGRLQRGPVLGICLGLQALYTRSEESGGTPGLGIFDGAVKHFNGGGGLKIPHIGWNRVRHTRDHPLWRGIADDERFYFVHSYYVASGGGAEVVGECDYGGVFTAAAARGNLFATQFHPEKSQRAGLQLLRNFLAWRGD